MSGRILYVIVILALAACSQNPHTIENTSHLSQEELAGLCADLQMRATMDCRWNMREQQSTAPNQQTWEINCRARRDSARESFDNVCQAWRFNEAPGNEEQAIP